MKIHTLPIVCTGLGLFATAVLAKDPVLNTPGTASWTNGTTATGNRTVFTLTDNTVLTWDQLNLAKGSELVFDFKGGRTVVNFLGGTGVHVIDGTVTSNGNVAFFSPTADLQVNGSIIAKEVTLATLGVDADQYASGKGYELNGSGPFNVLDISGNVTATSGDVVLGGHDIQINDRAQINASRDLLIGASRNFSVAQPGNGNRINEKSGAGFVLNLGTARASKIEIAAGNEIYNQGILQASSDQKLFLRVGPDGRIGSDTTALQVNENATGEILTGDSTLIPDSSQVPRGIYMDGGAKLDTDEGDAPSAVSESTVTFPALSRPDGTQVSTSVRGESNSTANSQPSGSAGNTVNVNGGIRGASSQGRESIAARTISYSVPMSASGDAARDSGTVLRNQKQVAKVDGSKSLLQRSSFFGMRGGSSTATAKR